MTLPLASFGQRELAADFCQHYLPAEIAATLDPDPAAWELQTATYVDETLAGHFADLVYLTRLVAGGEAYVCVLLEHKSAPDRFIALQLLRTMVRIWEEDRRRQPNTAPRPILPVVVYHGRRRWQVAQTLAGLVQPPAAWRDYCPDFRYLLSDVSQYGPAPAVGTPRLQARLLVLRAAFGHDLGQVLVAILDQLERLSESQLREHDLHTILLYLSATPNGRSPDHVREVVDAALRTSGLPHKFFGVAKDIVGRPLAKRKTNSLFILSRCAASTPPGWPLATRKNLCGGVLEVRQWSTFGNR